jgi:hypothetical protein
MRTLDRLCSVYGSKQTKYTNRTAEPAVFPGAGIFSEFFLFSLDSGSVLGNNIALRQGL